MVKSSRKYEPLKPRVDVHEAITGKIVAAIEAPRLREGKLAGTFEMPWHRPGVAFTIPRNALTGKPYRGRTIVLLHPSQPCDLALSRERKGALRPLASPDQGFTLDPTFGAARNACTKTTRQKGRGFGGAPLPQAGFGAAAPPWGAPSAGEFCATDTGTPIFVIDPPAERLSVDDAWAEIDRIAEARWCRPIEEIDRDNYMHALDVLPPVAWTTRRGIESFRLPEHVFADITDMFASTGDRYFILRDHAFSPEDIAERIGAYLAAHPRRPRLQRQSAPPPQQKLGGGS